MDDYIDDQWWEGKPKQFTLLVLKFALYSFSLSFKLVQFNFTHLVKTYLRSFKFAQVIVRVHSFWFV